MSLRMCDRLRQRRWEEALAQGVHWALGWGDRAPCLCFGRQ